jgi:hypothetical protein
MRVLSIVDLAVYFVVGMLAVLFASSLTPPPQEEDEDGAPRPYARPGTLALAAVVGLAMAGVRFGVVHYAKSSAMRRLTESLGPQADTVVLDPPVYTATAIPQASPIASPIATTE